jgi:hypothetical protein
LGIRCLDFLPDKKDFSHPLEMTALPMGLRGPVLSEVDGIDFDPAINRRARALRNFEQFFSSLLDLAAMPVL